jgi:hypothetical protein
MTIRKNRLSESAEDSDFVGLVEGGSYPLTEPGEARQMRWIYTGRFREVSYRIGAWLIGNSFTS